jgi:hypothetical protein
VPGTGNPQSWNRYTYVGNNPILYVDPDGHFPQPAKHDGGWSPGSDPNQKEQAANVTPAEPWYTPAVVGAAQTWQYLDSTIGEFGRSIEADRLVTGWRLQVGWKGAPLGPECIAETPFLTIKARAGVTARLDYGDPDGWRFDSMGGTTIRMPDVPEIEGYASGDLSELGFTIKHPPRIIAEDVLFGFGDVMGQEKGTLGVEFSKPLNATLITQVSDEYRLSWSHLHPAAKIEPSVRLEYTAHGGPTTLVAVPFAVYYGFPVTTQATPRVVLGMKGEPVRAS